MRISESRSSRYEDSDPDWPFHHQPWFPVLRHLNFQTFHLQPSAVLNQTRSTPSALAALFRSGFAVSLAGSPKPPTESSSPVSLQVRSQAHERPAQPGFCDAPILYASGDGTGVPMRSEELEGRRGKQADGSAKTRQVYLGCVFTHYLHNSLRLKEFWKDRLNAHAARNDILPLAA